MTGHCWFHGDRLLQSSRPPQRWVAVSTGRDAARRRRSMQRPSAFANKTPQLGVSHTLSAAPGRPEGGSGLLPAKTAVQGCQGIAVLGDRLSTTWRMASYTVDKPRKVDCNVDCEDKGETLTSRPQILRRPRTAADLGDSIPYYRRQSKLREAHVSQMAALSSTVIEVLGRLLNKTG
jgi:hypothetical protein